MSKIKLKNMYNSFEKTSISALLLLLKSHQTEYLSGQDLSDVLKISRVAIWKHIKKIRSLGYKIESKQHLGYKLTDFTDQLVPWEITDNLRTKLLGKRVYYFETIDSTQAFAIKIAANKIENGTVVMSKRQSKGRGRLKRKWESPNGGIWMSIIIHPKFDINHIMLMPIATSLALCLAIEKILKIKPELKWPNDLTVHGKKVAGILLDSSIQSNNIEYLVLGIGINFKIKQKKLENMLKKQSNFYGVQTLTKKNERPITLVKEFLCELENILHMINLDQNKKIVNMWTKRSSTIGKKIAYMTDNGKKIGKVIKMDHDGALVISSNKKRERLIVGDISYKN